MAEGKVYELTMYIAGMTPAARRAIENLEQLKKVLPRNETLKFEVIDILHDPDAAEDARILATPTVIRRLPPPIRRVIGELADHDQVKFGLRLGEYNDQ